MSLWNVDDYVRLRSGGDDPMLDELASRHDVSGKRVLDLGCGPGRAASALALRHGAAVTAVDANPEMTAAARAHVPPSVAVVDASAERLPFADATFDAVVANFVVHLIDRSVAFAEVRRVLRPGGTFWIKSDDPATLGDYWAVPLFPSYVEIESSRFPSEEQLRTDLDRSGFADLDVERFSVDREFTRADAVRKLKSGAYSTLRLLPPDELRNGIERAATVLPDPVRYTLTLLVVTATA